MPRGLDSRLLPVSTFTNPQLFQTYFTACSEESIGEFAATNLLAALTPKAGSLSQPASPVAFKQSAPPSPVTQKPAMESPTRSKFKPRPYLTLEPNDIARYLEDAASSKFGDWPVVVSQRGIKHLRQYIVSDKGVFARIENKIKYVVLCYALGVLTHSL